MGEVGDGAGDLEDAVVGAAEKFICFMACSRLLILMASRAQCSRTSLAGMAALVVRLLLVRRLT